LRPNRASSKIAVANRLSRINAMAEEKLVRGIGRWDLCAITINTIIGAGIFGLPSKVYALIGTYSLLAFIACTFIIGLIVLCYAEVSSRFARTGGPYLYAKEAFGTVVGFEVGWLYWIVRVATFAANCNLLVTYLGFFAPSIVAGGLRLAAITTVVSAIVAVNLLGVRESATVTNLLTVGKLLPLCVFGIVGLFFIDPANFSFAAVPDYSAFSGAVLILIYAFVGFEVAVVMAGEVQDPQHNVPFALLFSLAAVALLYIVVQIVCIGTLPGLATSERPLADAAANFLGRLGAGFVTTGAVISILGNLNVGLLGATRLLFAMSEQRDVPACLGHTHKQFKTPHWSILITGIIILILTIYSSFITALAIATITRLLVFATTSLALPVFRRRHDAPEAKFTVPLGALVTTLSLALIAWLLTQVDLTQEALPITFAALFGLALHALHRRYGARSNVP
jgi:amino acid transporter